MGKLDDPNEASRRENTMVTNVVETTGRKLLVSEEEAEKYFGELDRLDRLVEEREAQIVELEARVAELDRPERQYNFAGSGVPALVLPTGGTLSPARELEAAQGRLSAMLNARDALVVERDSLRRFVDRHVLAPVEPPPREPTERERLEALRQELVFEYATSGKGERRLREVEDQLAELDRAEIRARLVEQERARRAAEAERARVAAEGERLEREIAQAEAEWTDACRTIETALALLGDGVRAAVVADDRRYNLRLELSVLRGDNVRHGLVMGGGRDQIEQRVVAELARVALFKDHPWSHAQLEPLALPELAPAP